jgi:hypothetical protein
MIVFATTIDGQRTKEEVPKGKEKTGEGKRILF